MENLDSITNTEIGISVDMKASKTKEDRKNEIERRVKIVGGFLTVVFLVVVAILFASNSGAKNGLPTRHVILRAANRTLEGMTYEDTIDESDADFFFVQSTDTQFGMVESLVGRELPVVGYDNTSRIFYDQKTRNELMRIYHVQEAVRLKELIRKVNAMNPRPGFLVISGDMVDAYPLTDAAATRGNKRADQEKQLLKVLEGVSAEIPVVVVPGNHDLGNAPTADTIQQYKDLFGDDYFSFWTKGSLFLVLNSQLYKNSSFVESERTGQDVWLDTVLEDAKGKKPRHIVVLMHIPPFLESLDEETNPYFNLVPDVRKKLLQKFSDAGVTKIFTGHFHRNAGGFAFNLTMEVVVTSAISLQFGEDKPGARIVKLKQDEILHEYHSLENFPV